MDKYEYKLKIDELNRLIENQEFSEAQDIADTIDWEKVRDSRTLCVVSDLYKICRRYYDAKEVLLLAYVKNPKDKLIVYSLCELSIKLGDILNSIDFYNEYKELAGDDPSTYILLYKVYEIVEATSQEKIDALEAFQKFSRSYKPKWMYELAYLYHKNGRETDCVNQCNLILSFFKTGKYIIKTIELKQLHTELSSEDEILYKELTTPVEEIIVPEVNVSLDNTIDLQKELAGHLKDILGEEESVSSFEQPANTVNDEISDTHVIADENPAVSETVRPETDTENPESTVESELDNTDTYNIEETRIIGEISSAAEEENTASETEENQTDSVEDIDSAKTTVIPVITEEILNSDAGDTKVVPVKEIEDAITEITEEVSLADSDMTEIVPEGTIILNKDEIESALGGSKIEESFTDEEGQLKLDEVFASDNDRRVELDELLTLEGDGQISLVVPEDISVEKQITGQICIDEVLLMYEERRKKQEEEWDIVLGSEIEKKSKDIIDKANQELDSQLEETLKATQPPLVQTYVEDEILIDKDMTAEDIPAETTSEEETVTNEVAASEEVSAEEDILPEADGADENRPEEAAADENLVEADNEETKSSEYDFSYLDAFAANAERLDDVVEDAAGVAAVTEAVSEVSEIVGASGDTEEFKAISDTLDKMLEEEEEQDMHSETVPEEIPTESEEEIDNYENLENEESADEYVEDSSYENEENSESDEVAEEEPNREGFSERQWLRYESFVQTEVCREQIKEAIQNISHEACTGNVIIGSVDEDSAISLGKYFIEEFNDRGEINGKTVSVKAAIMNAKEPSGVFDALEGGALIITNADELRPETLRGIKEALEVADRKMFVAMAVSHRLKHKFIMANSEYLASFTVSVDIEALDDEELVKLAKSYAYSREFGIDDMGKLALHRIISEKQTNSHSVTYKEVKTIVDMAIAHASKHTIGHFFGNIFGKRFDSNDMIVLGEKDFKQ